MNLSITNGIVSSKIYDKQDDFNFEIVNFPFFDGDDPRSPSYGVYILDNSEILQLNCLSSIYKILQTKNAIESVS